MKSARRSPSLLLGLAVGLPSAPRSAAGLFLLVVLWSVVVAACSAAAAHVSTTASAAGTGGGTTHTVASATGAGGERSSSAAGTGGTGLLLDAGLPDGDGGGVADPTTCAEAAQFRSYVGCDFWPTVVANVVWSVFDYAVVVANAGTTTADITVTRNGQMIGTYHAAPNALATIYLPWVPELKGPDSAGCYGGAMPWVNSVVSHGGAYHLVSSVPVTVFQFNALEYKAEGGPQGKDWSSCPGWSCVESCFSFTNDASLLLPSTAMSGNYRITAPASTQFTSSYFAVTATQDNTTITVYESPHGNILSDVSQVIPRVVGGGKTTFTLNAGDVAELVGDTTSDHAGSLVKASAPVQIISGIPCAQEPASASACDHLEQTVFPAETLGKHYFITVPTAPRGNVVGHVVRFVGNVDGTILTYAGAAPLNSPTTLNAGQVIDFGVVENDFEVTGSNEFAVTSLMLGGSLLDPTAPMTMRLGDPSQTNSVAVEQYRTKYVFLAPIDYAANYVDIVLPMGADVLLDGAPLRVIQTPISSGYFIARQLLGPGNNGAHVLTSSLPVGIQVMGYGTFTSYLYPGGLNLHAIAPPPPPPS